MGQDRGAEADEREDDGGADVVARAGVGVLDEEAVQGGQGEQEDGLAAGVGDAGGDQADEDRQHDGDEQADPVGAVEGDVHGEALR